MDKYVLASVGDFLGLDPSNGDVLFTSQSLTEESFEFSATENEIRGGFLNGLLSSYLSDSGLAVNLTDALFSMEAIAMNVGGNIQAGGNKFVVETVTVSESGKVEVVNTPSAFGTLGTIGWVSNVGENKWTKVTFDASTKKAIYAPATIGAKYCVKYLVEDLGAETLVVPSAFAPRLVHGVMTLPIFKCNESGNVDTSKAKVGEVVIDIPQLQFDGNMSLSLTSNGNSTIPLKGKALKTVNSTDCANTDGEYAKITKIVFGANEWDGVTAIVIADSDIDLAVGETQTLEVLAIYGSGVKAPRLIDNSELTFTSSAIGKATVGANTGVVSAVASGESIIEVVVTAKSSLVAKAVVTVAE